MRNDRCTIKIHNLSKKDNLLEKGIPFKNIDDMFLASLVHVIELIDGSIDCFDVDLEELKNFEDDFDTLFEKAIGLDLALGYLEFSLYDMIDSGKFETEYEPPEAEEMYVVTNKDRKLGANVMVHPQVLREIACWYPDEAAFLTPLNEDMVIIASPDISDETIMWLNELLDQSDLGDNIMPIHNSDKIYKLF